MQLDLIILLLSFILAVAAWIGHEVMLARSLVKIAAHVEQTKSQAMGLSDPESNPRTSVLVCVRDGQDCIGNLLEALKHQEFNGDWEVVVIDDDSSDETWRMLEDFQQNENAPFDLKIFQLRNTRPGKKEALQSAIDHAKGRTLVLTDADCLPSDFSWLERMVVPLEAGKDLVLGVSLPRLGRAKGVLGALQVWDALRIVRSYVGWLGKGHPYMGVGRNLALRAKIHPGFESHHDLASGDDDLAIQQLLSSGSYATVALLDRASQMDSELPKTARGWVRQKQRHWTTASRYTAGDRIRLILPQLLTVLCLVSGCLALVAGFRCGVLHIALWIVVAGMGSAWLVAVLTFRSIAKACQTPDQWLHFGWIQPIGACWVWMMAITMVFVPSKHKW